MKKLGIIGGLGPMATAYFLTLIARMTKAEKDQEHIEIIMHSKPSIPDRTAFILGESSKNPVDEMIRVGKELERLGAEAIAIPCITAHFFHQQMEQDIHIPIFHAVLESAVYLRKFGVDKVGVLATDGTNKSGIITNIFHTYGIDTVYPDEKLQKDIMDIIYCQIKAGKKANIDKVQQIGKSLLKAGAQVNLLACTELSLLKRDCDVLIGYLDILEVLARKTVIECGNFDERFEHLISIENNQKKKKKGEMN